MLDLILRDVKKEDIYEDYDSPEGSKWIVAVDHCGCVTILDKPNIHPSLLEGCKAEELGLPDHSSADPGIYRWTCSYHVEFTGDSGTESKVTFEIVDDEILWSPTIDL